MSLTLPLVTDDRPQWEGLRPTALPALARAEEAPEPDAPQGDYATAAVPSTPVPLAPMPTTPVELLSPAGGPEAAFAAFHYGADAIYLGLKKFSARAEAENFTLAELSEVLAYAHAITPRRRVFVTINTVLRDDELPELIETLAALEAMGVDALIIQDLGVYHLVRRFFPRLELHASTQLAVHNRAGAVALRQLGFTRVVLARELTTEEVHDITSTAGIETEVFIHGALCYSYSGLCLFSSQTLGRSGNRGKCAYSCRDSYTVTGAPETLRDGSPVKRDPTTGFPFSMKDLALPDQLPTLRGAGVSCFKIEGRKKSPLYVATTTDYYRQLLDGTLAPESRPEIEADLQTVFSRPWTRLFTDSHKDKEVADRDTVGHRGTVIGRIESVRNGRLRFRTTRGIEKHDGLQVDLPTLSKPFGFAVDRLWVLGRKPEAVFEAQAGALVEVELPADYPELPIGAPVYCSSSQRVKRTYRHDRPKPGLHRTRQPMSVTLTYRVDEVEAVAVSGPVRVTQTLPGTFAPAKDTAKSAATARVTFEKLGDTGLSLEAFTLKDPEGLFVPVSQLNALRRQLCEALETALDAAQRERVAGVIAEVCPPVVAATPAKRDFRWSVKVDRLAHLDAFTLDDWQNVDEIIVDIARDHPTLLAQRLESLGQQLGRDRIRLSLPPLTRKWEERGIVAKIDKMRAAGWHRWEVGNVSGWAFLGLDAGATQTTPLDIATDWSVYTLNRAAASHLLERGVSRFCLSPEDGLANLRTLLASHADRAVVIVHQDTPQFLAESCAYANLIGGCPGKAACKFESMEMESSHGEKVLALDYHCRTIVLDQAVFCLSRRLDDLAAAGARNLRVDFIYRPYDAATVVQRWRDVRAGKAIPGGHAANFDRGLL
jgi:putative protease